VTASLISKTGCNTEKFSHNGKKKVYKWKPMSQRPLERPKNRWEDDIRNEMKKLKIKNWTN